MHRKGRPFRNLLPNLLQRIRAAGHSVSSRASMVSGGNLGGGRASTAHNSGTMDTVSMLSMPASYSGGYYDAVTSETESMMTASTLEPPSWSPRGSCQYANIGRVVGEDEEEGDDREDMEGLVMDGTTPTNSLTPRASPLPRRPDFGDRVVGKVSRLESLRDTQRRMKTVTQLLPKFILEASFEEVRVWHRVRFGSPMFDSRSGRLPPAFGTVAPSVLASYPPSKHQTIHAIPRVSASLNDWRL